MQNILHKQISLLLDPKKPSTINLELIQNLIKETEPLELYVMKQLNGNNVLPRRYYWHNFNNIIVHICLAKNTLDRDATKNLCSMKHICPLVLLITKDNFLSFLDTILNNDINNNFLQTVINSYKCFDSYSYYSNDVVMYNKYQRYVTLMYLGFILYPETKTVDIIEKYQTIVLLYTIMTEYERIPGYRNRHTTVPIKTGVTIESIIERIKIFKQNANVENIYELYDDTFNMLNSQNNILTFIFSNNTVTPDFVTNTFNSTNYKAVEHVLNNGTVPTTENFDSLMNNEFMKKLSLDQIDYHNNDNKRYTNKFMNIAIENCAKIVKLLLNYKLLPTDIFVNVLENIVKNCNTILSNKIDTISKDTYGIIGDIVSELVNYNYPTSNKIYSLLILKKNSIFKLDTITEELYYGLYKFYDLAMVILPADNFYEPLHIMRHMCLNKKTTLTAFKQYLKKNKIKPDRYCFEYASMYNKKIAEWMFTNNCLPTVKSTNIYNMRKANRFIDNKYLVKIVDTVQTQEYMCEQYGDLVV